MCGGCSESLHAFRFLFQQRTLNSPEVVLIMMPEDRSARRFRSTRMVDRGGCGYLSTGGDACWWKLCKVSVVVMPWWREVVIIGEGVIKLPVVVSLI